MELADFLLARIAEDKAAARAALPDEDDADGGAWGEFGEFTNRQGSAAVALAFRHHPARVLAECEAKRRIVAEAQDALTVGQHMVADDVWSGRENAYEEVLQFLALPYADHPDYRQEWRP